MRSNEHHLNAFFEVFKIYGTSTFLPLVNDSLIYIFEIRNGIKIIIFKNNVRTLCIWE